MGINQLLDLYVVCGAIGFIWIVGSAAFGFAESAHDGGGTGGDISSADGGGDMSNADTGGDMSNADASDGGDLGTADPGDAGNLDANVQVANSFRSGLAIRSSRRNPGLLLLKILSPSTLTTFLFFFGLAGTLIVHTFPVLGMWSLLPAFILGIVGYNTCSGFTGMLARKMHVSTSYRHDQVIGSEAEVTVPIGPGTLGEVTYSAKGVRDTAPARAIAPDASFSKGSVVVLCEIRDGIFYVAPTATSEWGTTIDTRDKLQKH